MTTKEELRRLVDELPEEELDAARRYLEYLRDVGDPVARAFDRAREDDEPETDEERAAVAEAKAALARREVLSDQELRDRLGL